MVDPFKGWWMFIQLATPNFCSESLPSVRHASPKSLNSKYTDQQGCIGRQHKKMYGKREYIVHLNIDKAYLHIYTIP